MKFGYTPATIATLVAPEDRSRLDAVADGRFATWHAESLRQVLRAVRERPLHAILVSPTCIRRDQLPGVGTLVSQFPGVPTVVVLARPDPEASERLLELGAYGVRRLVDLNAREGWERLRQLVGHPATPMAAAMLAEIVPALGDVPLDCRQFFEVLVRLAPGVTTVRALGRHLGVLSSTFMSRFFRARLPSPKRYLSAVRLVYAAALLESPGLSISDVALQLEYSSPQSFGRHLRTALGITASEFRRRYSSARALDELVTRLIAPFRETFRTFHPLDHGMSDPGHEG